MTLDHDGAPLRGLADSHHGVVVAAYGVGHLPAALAGPLGALTERVLVVLASRTGSGSVLSRTPPARWVPRPICCGGV
jgi:L-asparaginase